MAINFDQYSDEQIKQMANQMMGGSQSQVQPSNSPSIQIAPKISSIEPSQGNLVFTESNGITNLPGLAAQEAVKGQSEINKAVAQKKALMPLESQAEQQKQLDTANVKKLEFGKELGDFLTLDEAIPRGEGLYRFANGANNLWHGFAQDNSLGVAVAAHQAASLKLRTSIARLKDVGNLSENEQQAAGQMIPGLFDSDKLVELKRAYLKQLGVAIDSKQPSLVKQVMDSFKKSEAFDPETHAQNTNSVDVNKYFTRKSSVGNFKI